METAIGVFSSRDRAEEAVRALLENKIPQDSIVFLTRSETEAHSFTKELGATVGGFMGAATGMSAGVAAATLLVVPGLGPVFALGFGAAALFGLVGAQTGSAVGRAAVGETSAVKPTPAASDDAAFFKEVLNSGRSLVVVRTESAETAKTASQILDRYGIGLQGHAPVKMQTDVRHTNGIAIIDVRGRITVTEGTLQLREIVRELVDQGHRKVLLNLHEVGYVDSSGMGELVMTLTSMRNAGGQLKLVNVSHRVQSLLELTRLSTVFDIQADEASAIHSFEQSQRSVA